MNKKLITTQKREQSTELIVEAALELFSENGYDKTTIRMIAQKAGISLGLLYNYFVGKDELLKEIYRKSIRYIRASLQDDGDLLKANDVESYIRLTFRLLKENKKFWKLFYGIRMQSPIIQDLENEMKAENNYIQKRMEQKLLHANIPFPGLEAKLLFATIEGISHHYLLKEDYPLDDVANLLLMKYRHY